MSSKNKSLSFAIKPLIVLAISFLSWGCTDNSSTDPIVQVVASFDANARAINQGETITFTDKSEGTPTSWEWQFEGGTPSSSTMQSPTVQYENSGVYSVTLKVSNGETEDTKTEPEFIEVNCLCSSECTESCKSQLLEDLSISINGADRTYDVYLPPTYDLSTEQLPVIIDLHGYTSSSDEQRSISNFTDLADENNIVMVWPEALDSGPSCILPGADGKFWNADWGSEVDDIAFIDQLLDQIETDYNIDPKRIYVTGLSNGGFMAYSIACALSDRIAAITSVAGSMTTKLLTSECRTSRQIPILHIHGTEDQVVPWDGKEDCYGGIASVDEIISFWRANSDCYAPFTEVTFPDNNTTDGSTASLRIYEDCRNRVNLLIVKGGGHNWPGSEYQINQGYSILLPINKDIVVAEVIWDFFKLHALE